MSLLLFKITATSIILATSLMGIWAAKYTQISQHSIRLGESFTSGIFLGAALFHMMPDAIQGFHTVTTSFITAYLLILSLSSLSFLILLITELNITISNTNTLSYLLMFILSSHSILAGAALGSYINIKPALILFMAIILHKGLASFALATKLFNQMSSNKQIYLLLFIFAIMTPSGIIIASGLGTILQTQAGLTLESSLNALAAGAFLYLGIWHKNVRDIYSGHYQNIWLHRSAIGLGALTLMGLAGI